MLRRLRNLRAVLLIIGIILGIGVIDRFLYPVLPQPLRATILGLDQSRLSRVSGFIGTVRPFCGGTEPPEEDLKAFVNNPTPLPLEVGE